MYIERVPNRSSPPAVLLRESYRHNGKVKKRTIANLSDWPAARVEEFRAFLKGAKIGTDPSDAFEITRSRPHVEWHMRRDLAPILLLWPRGELRVNGLQWARARARQECGHEEETLMICANHADIELLPRPEAHCALCQGTPSSQAPSHPTEKTK